VSPSRKVTPARVARIPYLNATPFFTQWADLERASDRRWTETVLPPRQLGEAAEAGQVDAGLMAVADLVRLEETFEPLATTSAIDGFGIANSERVDSVLFFLREDLCDTDYSGPCLPTLEVDGQVRMDITTGEARRLRAERVSITVETATSIWLLRLLLDERMGIPGIRYQRADLSTSNPTRAPGAESVADDPVSDEIAGFLVIGDDALRWRMHPPHGYRQRIDLAFAWRAWTGRPFVFARWAVRRELPLSTKQWLAEFLEGSLEAGERMLPELARENAASLSTSPDALQRYLEGFAYRISSAEIAGYELFAEQLRVRA